ncbi:unnamed protein product [Mucor fragilis]
MNVEGRMMQQQQQQHHQQRKYSHYQQQQQQQQQKPTMADTHQFSHLPANAVSALMAHKNQQRQLEALQEQLRLQQQLLAKHNILPEHLTSPPSPPPMPSSSSLSTKPSSFANHLYSSSPHNNYNSISIPSSRSSNSDDNDHVIIPHHSH